VPLRLLATGTTGSVQFTVYAQGQLMTKILAFSGSTRRDAWNRKLIQAAVDATRAAGGEVTLIDLADYPLPIYHGDLEDKEGLPDSALRLKALFKDHDALLISSPEYNSSIPPLLKNTIDWVSREWQGESGLLPYQNKVAAIMSATPGALGGMRMLPHLRQILDTLGVIVLPGQFALSHADQAFDPENGALKSPARLHALLVGLVNTTFALSTLRT
jgi:chromate reductase